VLFGGLAYNDYCFLEGAYAAAPDIGQFFDAVALHPYTDHGASPETVNYGPDCAGSGSRITKGSFTGFTEVRKDLLAQGADKPIWLDEFGWATLQTPHPTLGGVDPQTQADYLTRAYKLLENYPYVPVAIWYDLRNDGNDDFWTDQLGLTQNDFTPKPSYYAFKSYGAPSPAPPPASPPASQPVFEPTPTAPVQPVVAPAPMIATQATLNVRTRRYKHSKKIRLSMFGELTGAQAGSVTLAVERKLGSGWRVVTTYTTPLDRLGRFGLVGKITVGATWRIRAVYNGDGRFSRSASPFSYVRAGR
jgi:hypothetical protein